MRIEKRSLSILIFNFIFLNGISEFIFIMVIKMGIVLTNNFMKKLKTNKQKEEAMKLIFQLDEYLENNGMKLKEIDYKNGEMEINYEYIQLW